MRRTILLAFALSLTSMRADADDARRIWVPLTQYDVSQSTAGVDYEDAWIAPGKPLTVANGFCYITSFHGQFNSLNDIVRWETVGPQRQWRLTLRSAGNNLNGSGRCIYLKLDSPAHPHPTANSQ